MDEDVLQPDLPETPEAADMSDLPETPKVTDTPPEKGKHKGKLSAQEALLAAQAEMDVLQTELTQVKDAYARTLAEYANYKRRTDQEKIQLGAFTTAELLKALLPTLDNLERAQEAIEGADADASSAADAEGDAALFTAYRAGVDMAFSALQKELTGWGLEAIDPLEQPFDPEAHNAVAREEAGDGEATDIVTAVLQKGYRVGERILRPAMVRVRS